MSEVTEAHVDAVMQVTRRAVIDEIDKMINNLQESPKRRFLRKLKLNQIQLSILSSINLKYFLISY